MHSTRRWVASLLLLWLAGAASAVERVSIPSLDGTIQLPGYWFKARADGPRPVVIFLHGCNGALDSKGNLGLGWTRDASYFNEEGMHLLVLDSFTSRGESSICETPTARRRIHEETRRDDVFAAVHWLALQPAVDKARIAVAGRSHGGSTVLSVVDRTDKAVRAEPIQPRAAIALYPGCGKYLRMWNYEVGVPLLMMSGELDDWTPAQDCRTLAERVQRAQPGAVNFVIYPGSHHGFDGVGPVALRENVAATRSGRATVGGNPQAREQSHERIFEFLSRQFDMPLVLTHEQRLRGHRYVVPEATGFAQVDDVAAVPVNEAGKARYERYLALERPKAFAITERGGWHFSSNDKDAMKTSLEFCQRESAKCWLYAVDDRVVWNASVADRVGPARLQSRTSP